MPRNLSLARPFLLACILVSGCAGGPFGGRPPTTCEQLSGTVVPASALSMPTSGARVLTSTLTPGGGSGAKAFGEYCLVAGEIGPVDLAAPKIKFQLALPTAWNHKTLMLGGGGYDGSVPNIVGNVPAGPADQLLPIGRGYAVFAGDSGHEGLNNQGAFGVNDEALRNFSFEALKKTRDTAMYLVEKRYGERPIRNYFAGGSTGGREALAFTQRWPQDMDGVIALYPAFNAAALDLAWGRITRALAAPGAYPNLAKRKALYDAALEACDAADGVVDGLISDQVTCNATFDPATATLKGQPLRCTGGADAGDTCLSDLQISAMRVINTPIVFSFPLASGEIGYPGFNTWGSDFGRPGAGVQGVVNFLGLGTLQPVYPMPPAAGPAVPGTPFGSTFWDQWVKYFVTRDASFNSLTLDPENPGPWRTRISDLTALQDINKADLSAFESRGGKILMAHGVADQLVSTRATEDYYQRVRAAMGADRTARFVRYYEIPGYNHAYSTTFNAAWDSLTALENWVENGTAPTGQVVFDTVGVAGRSRPLCEYPTWPRYRGSGDVNVAANFACVSR